MSAEEKVLSLPEGIDFNQEILDLNDKPIKDGENALRLGDVCCSALLANMPSEQIDGTQKLKRFNLARKIQGDKNEDEFAVMRLNSTQKTQILELVAKVYTTVVYGRVYEALEGPAAEGE